MKWTNLYGNYQKVGVSMRLVQSNGTNDITSVLESGGLHLFLNLSGDTLVFGDTCRLFHAAKTLSCCMIRDQKDFLFTSLPGQITHQIIVLCVTPEWILQYFGSEKQSLNESIVELLTSKGDRSLLLYKVRSMSYLEYEISSSLLSPPVHKDAQSFWYLAKIIELLTLHLFKPSSLGIKENFCSRQKQLAQQRVDQVLIWLEENFEKPLNLPEMSKKIHCSPSYLSRVFSEHTGVTISRKLRGLRVQKAKELLDSGEFNVTEVALEVGYNSLSHFAKAFKEEAGKLPSEYLR